MSVDSDLRAELIADATVTGLVASRIYPGTLPQNPTYPAISYFRVSGPRLYHLNGAAGRATPRYQIDCWAETHLGARALAEAVRAVLSGFRGAMGSTSIGFIRLANEIDVHEDEVDKYRVILDFLIDHAESA